MARSHHDAATGTMASGRVAEVFAAFLKLGLTSFGGPIAHLGYFRREFVERRKWIDETDFARLLALCQFLPGPASSQLGFSVGLLRAGWPGALVAFAAFTLPSAVLLFAFAALLPYLSGEGGQAAIHGLKLVAVAVVAQGVLAMARQLCPDRARVYRGGCGRPDSRRGAAVDAGLRRRARRRGRSCRVSWRAAAGRR